MNIDEIGFAMLKEGHPEISRNKVLTRLMNKQKENKC